MRALFAVLMALALVAVVRAVVGPAGGGPGGDALPTMAFGFVLIVSFLAGRIAVRVGLPAITGYLVAGVAYGPYVLGALHPTLSVFDPAAIAGLRVLDAVALGLIALSAGGEMNLVALRARWRVVTGVLVAQTLIVPTVTAGLVLLASPSLPVLQGLSPAQLVTLAVLCGVAALANSPASVLAVAQELDAKGAVSETMLAVTVAKDAVVITLLAAVLAAADAMLAQAGGNADAQASPLLTFALGLWEVLGSLVIGLVLGWLMTHVLERVGHELPLLVLGMGFGAMTLLPQWHLSGLLALMCAGVVIENASPHGDRLIRAIERHALPMYVVFFTLAGADMSLPALRQSGLFALGMMLTRALAMGLSTALGARLAGEAGAVVRFGWTGTVAQAGVTLGLIVVVSERLPEIGAFFAPLMLAVVALNQLAGPVLYRWGLIRAGEAGG